jgi:ubiquinone/menaquinone biosynthesis C-methylase UbiE
MYEASKAMARRPKYLSDLYFKGYGVDIGAGPDCIDKHGYTCKNWDLPDGDAQEMVSVQDNTFDYVHSAHCLEHMVNVRRALSNWIRVTKPGGYLVIIVPDQELYEHNWPLPSRFNSDHKFMFYLNKPKKIYKYSVDVLEMVRWFEPKVELIYVKRNEEGYDFSKSDYVDQTLKEAECSIEIVLRKKQT